MKIIPERENFLVHFAERGHLWRDAIRAYRAGERGLSAKEAIRSLADECGLELTVREHNEATPPSTRAPRALRE